MSQMIASTKSRTFPAAALGLILAIGPLSACSTVEKGWRSTKDAVGGLFSSSDDEKAAQPAEETAATPEPTSSTATTAPTGGGGLFMGNSEVAGKFKSAAPAPAAVEKPKAVTEPPKKRTIEVLWPTMPKLNTPTKVAGRPQ